MPGKTQLSKEAVRTEECGWRELSETRSEEEAAPAMPPTLAGLHRPHPVLVLPMQEEWDISQVSMGCGADFSPGEGNTSAPSAAQPESVGEHDEVQWLWGHPPQALSQPFPSPEHETLAAAWNRDPAPSATGSPGPGHVPLPATCWGGREGCSPSHPDFLQAKIAPGSCVCGVFIV